MIWFASFNEDIHNWMASLQITSLTEIQEKTVLTVLERRSWTADCIDHSAT